jgi:hypothetical protein
MLPKGSSGKDVVFSYKYYWEVVEVLEEKV